jgi:hypothetical protein
MHAPGRVLSVGKPYDAPTHDRRDVVVMQAIANVTDRQPMEGWWEFTPGGRTHAIYDEVKRLDQARVNEPRAAGECRQSCLSDSMTRETARNSPRLVADAIAIAIYGPLTERPADACTGWP